MQPSNYYNEEDPQGNDDYIKSGGEDGTRSSCRPHAAQQQQFPRGSRFPLPPMWTLVPTQQHVAPPKVKLPPFWPKKPNYSFTLAESTFNRHNVVDSRLSFVLVLPALPEEVIEQIRCVLRAVDHLDCPYLDLKARLLRLHTPKPAHPLQ